MKILIVDDEPIARDRIRRFLTESAAAFDVSEAANGIEALDHLNRESFDLVFLDIEMPGLSGFEVLQNLELRPFKVIFETAFDEFAIRAFEENACDYLLKPFTLERFQKALAKAREQIANTQKLERLEQLLQQRHQFLDRLCVKVGAKSRIIHCRDIDCFTSRDHYTFIHSSGTECLTDLSLKSLETRLDPMLFLRIHRNAIVRLDRVKSWSSGPQMSVELNSGLTLPVARAQRKALRSALKASLL